MNLDSTRRHVAFLQASLGVERAKTASLAAEVDALEYRAAHLVRALDAAAAPPATTTTATTANAAGPAIIECTPSADLAFRLGDGVSRDRSDDERVTHCIAMLDRLGIAHDTAPHGEAKTMDAVLAALSGRTGVPCKNLVCKGKKLSRTRKPDTKIWLIVAKHDTDVKLKLLSKQLGYKDAIRFVRGDLLRELLGAEQGEVSPFHLVNDPALRVQVVLDAAIVTDTTAPCFFHPMCCTASSAIAPADLLAFVRASGREPLIVDFKRL